MSVVRRVWYRGADGNLGSATLPSGANQNYTRKRGDVGELFLDYLS